MKFKIVKHFSLDFLGEEWKEAFIDFRPLTIADVKERLPQIAKLQDKDADYGPAADVLVELLRDKFIAGKAVTETGVVDLKLEDIPDLPIEVIGRAFSFLSQSNLPTS